MHRPRGRIWISVALVGGFALAGQAQGTADHPHPSAATSASAAPAARSTPHTVVAPPQTVATDRIAPARARAADTPVVGAQVNYVYTSPPLPRSFLGTSVEYPALHVYAGRDPNHVDPVFINLLRGLVPGQPAIMRIGGDSADDSWLPERGVIPPGGITYSIGADWIATARAVAHKLDARLILGVNLAGNRPSLAGSEARALLQGVGTRNVAALEIGNEPDLYANWAWYRDKHKRWIYARPHSYDINSFIVDYTRWESVLPVVPLVGPSTAQLTWLSDLPKFISAAPTLRMVTVHRYPLRGCSIPISSPIYASIPNLLADSSSAGLAQSVAAYVARTHQAGLPFRIDELNSVACRGRWGVSNTFASALWALDTLYNLVAAGVDGVNFHILPGAAYELFSPAQHRGRWRALVRPEYYGLLMFARAFPAGAHLLQVNVPDGPVKVWATRGQDGHTRVMLINKDANNPVTVRVQIQYATGPASVERLTAPRIDATSGVTLGGQTFGPATSTGRLAGSAQDETVTPDSAGNYSVNLPAGSAALLTR